MEKFLDNVQKVYDRSSIFTAAAIKIGMIFGILFTVFILGILIVMNPGLALSVIAGVIIGCFVRTIYAGVTGR